MYADLLASIGKHARAGIGLTSLSYSRTDGRHNTYLAQGHLELIPLQGLHVGLPSMGRNHGIPHPLY